uniref:NACHT domain-containing protein n=1 Tax=Amphimedon queenslandica TaxID=400682 RepID=A0A1X7UWT5_AMPQE
MTGIYNHYVRVILKRHLIDAEVIDINYEMPSHLIHKIDFTNSELKYIWEDFYNLSRMAYFSVMKQEYTFGKQLHNVSKLSMMDTISSFSGFDKDESSSFIHTTLQDYFAAIYLVNNPHLMFNETDMKKNSNLENVLIFYAGLLKYIDREIGKLNMLRTDVFRSNNIIHVGINPVAKVDLPNIEHLDRVLSELEHFADAEWKSFGLKCGLHYNTLKAIERDAGSTKECFTECVACWLMMKDNVSKKGKPTLERLADIVEKIGDKATAKKIRIHNGIVVKGLEIHQVYMAWAFNPTVNSPIDEYALKLREKYNKTLTRYKDPDINKYPAAGPTAPVVPFISLKLIRLKSYQKKADAEFLHSVDKEILEHDNFEKIKIDDILKPLTGKPLRFVLIEGEPGIGKSTLAKELALQWAERTDKLLNNFKIIILIPLRLEIYQKAENIEDLLIYVEDIDMVKITSSINRARGAEVLWILDGFDELPHHLRNSSTSIFIKLIKGDILPKSTVIVTSRHAATDRLLTFLEDDSKHIVLRGFGPNEILEYVSKYFKNEVVLFEFQSHYSGNTVIENMLYNPMNCFIMCKIFTDFIHTKNNKYPITMTAIYNYYVRVILKRHLIDARVTYNGVMKQEYVFGKELHNVLKLSMMDTISSFTGFDKDESSSFIHTTLQDYLAAIYLVNNPGSMFTEIDMKQNSNLEDVFIFYVGLSKHIDRKIGTLDMLRTNFTAQMFI